MKTRSIHFSKKYFLLSVVFYSLFPGIISIGWGQTKLTNDPFYSGKKDVRVQAATARPYAVPENNSFALKANSNDSFENSQPPETPMYFPLATRIASVSGPWSSTTTWGGAAVPTSSDAVTINSGITVTVDMIGAQCASLTFAAVNASSAVTISGSNSLTISGALTMPRPASGQTCTMNVNAGTLSCGSLTMTATNAANPDIVNITTGTATISGALTTSSNACQFYITGAGTLNMGGAYTGTPTLSTVPGSTVNYTGAAAQNIYPIGYQGNLGLSGAGIKTIPNIYTANNLVVLGNFTNSSTLVLSAGTSSVQTNLVMEGNAINNPGATITATADYTNFYFYGTSAQTFTNNGILTAPLSSFTLENNTGLTLLGSNQIVCSRVNMFYGTITNSNKITLGNGGTSYATVQRGVASNTFPAGNFDVAPSFNVGTTGLYLLYDDGLTAYNTGFEVPGTLSAAALYIFDAADITLSSDLAITNELNFYGGTGTPALRIGAHTLTIGGAITYTVPGSFNGGTSSNLVMNGATIVNAITGGLKNFTINANTTLSGAVNVNNTLTLTNGWLINGSNLTMASGSTISRSGGNLYTTPTFAGTVNLLYTGSPAITTGKELPTTTSTLNNITTNTGGVTQFAYGTTNLLTDAFPDLTSWTGDKGTAPGQYNSVASANAGGTSPEAEFIGSGFHGNATYSIYRGPVNTTGYTMLNVSFKTATSGVYTPNVATFLKLQSSTSTGGPWHDVWSNTYTKTLSAQTILISNYSTDVGGNIYFRFAYVGDYYALDYWYFDDLIVEGVNPTPIAATVIGTLDMTNGPYTIIPTGQLTVTGNTTLNGPNCLILKSDATGTASFIDNGFVGTGTAKVERYLTPDTYHYISSPISNATANVFLNDYLMTSDPSKANGWSGWIVNPATPLQVMRGYACWKPSSNVGLETFSGMLNTGTQTFTDSRIVTDPWRGWHLVGNPYPSAISLTTGITWDHFEAAAYFWDQSGSGNPFYPSGNYNVALASPANFGTHVAFAPAEQGFFVHITNSWVGSSTLTLTNAARVHNGVTFLKDAPVIKDALLMVVLSSINTYSDRISVHFNPEATSGYNPGYDAYKLWGLSEAPQLYTRIGDTNVTCNSLPFEKKNMVIPMGFSCGLPGTYTLIADSLGTFENAISISLEDLKLNTTQDLRTNPIYNFTYDTLDDPNRFVLHFDNPYFGVNDSKNIQPMQIYSFGNTIYIKSQDGNLQEGSVFLYDLIGKELFNGTLSNQVLNRITPGVAEGYYVVKVMTDQGVYTGKVYLK